MSFFPFYIDIEGKNCLVIGGGTVALRKIEKIAPFKPKIVVIAPEICEEIRKLDIVCRFRKFEDGDLENTDFVICATNDESLNTHIFQLCNSKKLLINTVDNKENLDDTLVAKMLKKVKKPIILAVNKIDNKESLNNIYEFYSQFHMRYNILEYKMHLQ